MKYNRSNIQPIIYTTVKSRAEQIKKEITAAASDENMKK